MPEYNASLARLEIPARIRRLAVSPQGFPIPFFVQKAPLDFRVIAPNAFVQATRGGRCWICGEPRGRTFAFVAGPMCALNRTSSEPPSHRECAEFAAVACPFLSNPRMRRNVKDLPEHKESPGFHLDRNPGVTLVWVTRGYKPFQAHAGGGGVLIEMGEPIEALWFREGRPATRDEVFESIDSGMPHLVSICNSEPTEARRIEAKRALSMALNELHRLLPARQSAAA